MAETLAPARRLRLAKARPPRDSTAGILTAGLAVATALVAAQIPANLVDFGVYHYPFALLNPNNEGGLFAWIGGIMIAVAGAVCLLQFRVASERGRYLLAGLLLGVVAVENRARIDEQSFHRAVVYGPLFAALLVTLIAISWQWAPAPRWAVWAGIASLLCSLALHKLAPHVLTHYGYGPGDWPWEVKVSLKESSELFGWALICAALLAVASRRSGPLVGASRPPVAEASD